MKTVEKSPERMRITPVKAEVVEAGCRLPQNFSGEWVNTANIDADVFINETHLIETYYPDKARYRRTIYVCKEQRDTRIMMARLTVDGWWVYILLEYLFLLIPIRRTVDLPYIQCNKFPVKRITCALTLCRDITMSFGSDVVWPSSKTISVQFALGSSFRIEKNGNMICFCVSLHFDECVNFCNLLWWSSFNVNNSILLFLAKNPVPVRCPVAGKFNFTQRGEHPFKTRYEFTYFYLPYLHIFFNLFHDNNLLDI